MIFKYPLILFFLFVSMVINAQQGDIKIGADLSQYRNPGGFYDYSDPEAMNIKVSVWGYVRYPGRYLVPSYIQVRDLLSYAGGPTDDAHLDDLRIYHVAEDSTQSLYKFSYNDLLWGENLTSKKEIVPRITVGDVLLVPGEPRFYFRDYFSMTLSIVSAIVSIGILIVSIVRK